jgi:hypothetical protein
MPVQDGCIFVRDVYNGFLKICGTNKYVTSFLFGSPVYWTIGAVIVYSPDWNKDQQTQVYYKNTIASPVYTVLSILSFTWLLASFAVLRFWPNLVSVPVFVYEVFGHWCLVTLVLLAYVSGSPSFFSTDQVKDQDLKNALMKMYVAFIAMPICLLLLSAEILRTHRSKMFSHNVSEGDRMIETPGSANSKTPSEL